MTGGIEAAVNAEVEGAFPGLRERFQLKFVTDDDGLTSLAAPSPKPATDRQRQDLLTICNAIGQLQTGRTPTRAWQIDAIKKIAEASLGVADFDVFAETSGEALDAVLTLARGVWKHESKLAGEDPDDIPF